MIFNSLQFGVFFLAVYTLYLVLPHRAQNRMLLVASYVFYGWWDWRFLSLLMISTLVDFTCGLGIRRTRELRRRRAYLAVSVVVNLGMLAVFKYFGFFADSMAALMERLGVELGALSLNVVLPVGISFYTFQTMSYTIDIYRGKIQPTRRFLDFALFVAFFPQLVAGPIERASRLLPQILKPRRLSGPQLQEGLFLIGWGLFKKVVIADNVGLLVNRVFAGYQAASGLEVLVALYAFFLQIYCDFSGYSDIARGLAKMMGFELMVNFRLPFLASNPVDWWQRWHISLSTWIRDYLFVPLGANRRGTERTIFNLLLTMTLIGLWHGASWTFVLWGLYFGVIQVGHLFYQPLSRRYLRPRSPRGRVVFKWMNVLAMFHIVVLSLVLFRASSVEQSMAMARTLFGGPFFAPGLGAMVLALGFFAAPVALMMAAQHRADDLLMFLEGRSLARWAGGLAVFYVTLFVYFFGAGIKAGEEFIYFQF